MNNTAPIWCLNNIWTVLGKMNKEYESQCLTASISNEMTSLLDF